MIASMVLTGCIDDVAEPGVALPSASDFYGKWESECLVGDPQDGGWYLENLEIETNNDIWKGYTTYVDSACENYSDEGGDYAFVGNLRNPNTSGSTITSDIYDEHYSKTGDATDSKIGTVAVSTVNEIDILVKFDAETDGITYIKKSGVTNTPTQFTDIEWYGNCKVNIEIPGQYEQTLLKFYISNGFGMVKVQYSDSECNAQINAYEVVERHQGWSFGIHSVDESSEFFAYTGLIGGSSANFTMVDADTMIITNVIYSDTYVRREPAPQISNVFDRVWINGVCRELSPTLFERQMLLFKLDELKLYIAQAEYRDAVCEDLAYMPTTTVEELRSWDQFSLNISSTYAKYVIVSLDNPNVDLYTLHHNNGENDMWVDTDMDSNPIAHDSNTMEQYFTE